MSLPISVCLPFFDRKELAQGLASIVEHYGGEEGLEVIISDDGSMELPARTIVAGMSLGGLDIRIDYIDPPKHYPLNPCLPLNRAVALAKNDLIVLTNPEVRHIAPVFGEMIEEWKRQGPDSIICAAVWAEGVNQWYQHSVHYRTGFHHCNLMAKALFDRVGGFEMEYRYGMAYDDTDFVQKCHASGAKFVWRDDLVVNHIQHPPTEWTALQNNQALFFEKWPDGKRSTETRIS